jgi:hypothetical protein
MPLTKIRIGRRRFNRLPSISLQSRAWPAPTTGKLADMPREFPETTFNVPAPVCREQDRLKAH